MDQDKSNSKGKMDEDTKSREQAKCSVTVESAETSSLATRGPCVALVHSAACCPGASGKAVVAILLKVATPLPI